MSAGHRAGCRNTRDAVDLHDAVDGAREATAADVVQRHLRALNKLLQRHTAPSHSAHLAVTLAHFCCSASVPWVEAAVHPTSTQKRAKSDTVCAHIG